MAQSGPRKCLCCWLFFDPDPRNRERQRYGPAAQCRRAGHPGYGRGRHRTPRALQDSSSVQVPYSAQEYANGGEIAVAPALQDSWSTLPPALAGLIAHLFEHAGFRGRAQELASSQADIGLEALEKI